MSDWREKLYPHLPVFMQNVACSIHGRGQRKLRYGGAFCELLSWLEETEWWSVERIRGYQELSLIHI